VSNLNPDEMAAYEASLKIARDNYSHDETVRKESRRERDLEIAITLIAKGYSIEEIAEITDLSKEEIEKL
jgi:predicted transposase/invertase (TIGR01784 family)